MNRFYAEPRCLLVPVVEYKVLYMPQVIVELDDRTMRRLEEAAPASARLRSQFIRDAIRRALDARVEADMERAYREKPQDSVEVDLDAATWEPARAGRGAAPRKAKSRKAR
jgi:hypothetical protein